MAQPGNEPLAEKGHTSQRDVLRDMITAVKAKGIKVFFYTQAWEGYTRMARS